MDRDTVIKVAKLARLKLQDTEINEMAVVLSNVLVNFEKIANVPTAGVVPLLTPNEVVGTLRPDKIEKHQESDQLLSNAPEKSGRLFKVPPVV